MFFLNLCRRLRHERHAVFLDVRRGKLNQNGTRREAVPVWLGRIPAGQSDHVQAWRWDPEQDDPDKYKTSAECWTSVWGRWPSTQQMSCASREAMSQGVSKKTKKKKEISRSCYIKVKTVVRNSYIHFGLTRLKDNTVNAYILFCSAGNGGSTVKHITVGK